MKQVKAYVRPSCLEEVIAALEAAGARDITVIRVDALGALADADRDRLHVVRWYAEKYAAAAKLELVCRDEEAAGFAAIIQQCAHTGDRGDGRIFIANIEQAINIRTGEEGDQAL